MAREWLREWCIRKIGGDEAAERLKAMYESGAPIKEIMRSFGLTTPQCIYLIVGRPRRRGSYKSRVRVTAELERAILELRGKGESMPSIAKALGVSVGTVYRVLRKYGRS